MSDTRITQSVTASLTYVDDWTNRLAKAYPGQTITITSATGAITGGGVISAVSGSGTSVTFHLSVASVPAATDVVATLTATLSNGDVDPRKLIVGATT